MNTYIMSIDQGTTSTRAILFDQKSNVIGIAQKELATQYPASGWVEQDANEIWASAVSVMVEVMAKTGINDTQIAAIGITNQRETTLIWDKATGVPIYSAIVWQSRQSECYCQQMRQKGVESYIKETTGLIIDPYFSASKIRWMLDHVEGSQQRAENGELLFGTIDTWLLWKLTNGKQHMSDVSNASRTMLMNLKTLDYDNELLELWQIPRCMLPQIHATSELYGYTKGIFDHPIPIASLCGDQQAALFGQTCFEAGDIKNTYGTGCFLLMNTKNRIIKSKHGLLSSVGWKLNGDVDYVLEGSVFIAGAAIQWLRDGLKMIDNSSESEQLAFNVTNNGGVYIVPSFTGLGAPYWEPNVKGAIFGLTRGTTKEHIVRATLESLAYQTCDVIDAMVEDSGLNLQHMKVDGGASKDRFLMQFQADMLNAIIIRSNSCESTALGAAYFAGLAIGYWKDKQDIKRQFQIAEQYAPRLSEEERLTYKKSWKKAIFSVLTYK